MRRDTEGAPQKVEHVHEAGGHIKIEILIWRTLHQAPRIYVVMQVEQLSVQTCNSPQHFTSWHFHTTCSHMPFQIYSVGNSEFG